VTNHLTAAGAAEEAAAADGRGRGVRRRRAARRDLTLPGKRMLCLCNWTDAPLTLPARTARRLECEDA
jgi:hypothetical protein